MVSESTEQLLDRYQQLQALSVFFSSLCRHRFHKNCVTHLTQDLLLVTHMVMVRSQFLVPSRFKEACFENKGLTHCLEFNYSKPTDIMVQFLE